MCKAFSCLVTKDGKVYWKAGVDSHEEIEKLFNLNPPKTPQYEADDSNLFARVEIVPDNQKKYPYLWPELQWKLTIDERITPDWLSKEHTDNAWVAHQEWKDVIYKFDYEAARHPVNPLKGKAKQPTDNDINLLKNWDSVWDSVGDSVRDSVWDSVWDSVRDLVGDSVVDSVRDSVWDSVWDSVGDSVRNSVRDSVWDSVRSYIGSMFPNIKEWKYIKHEPGTYPYQSCVDLWLKGFVPSFDGKIWRLHSGKEAKVVYEWSENRHRLLGLHMVILYRLRTHLKRMPRSG